MNYYISRTRAYPLAYRASGRMYRSQKSSPAGKRGCNRIGVTARRPNTLMRMRTYTFEVVIEHDNRGMPQVDAAHRHPSTYWASMPERHERRSSRHPSTSSSGCSSARFSCSEGSSDRSKTSSGRSP